MNAFVQQLKETKYTNSQIRTIIKPLLPKFPFKKLLFLLFPIFLYYITYSERISWGLAAISRITLIKTLPYWNWPNLKNQKCLFYKTPLTHSPTEFQCDICENLHIIDEINEITPEYLKKRYLDLDIPLIIKQELPTWPKNTNLIVELRGNSDFSKTVPCNVGTNTLKQPTSRRIHQLLTGTQNFDSFFLHFQNCDFQAVKQMRSYTLKPSFLPNELSPVQYSWVLWNKNYESNFKTLALIEKLAVIVQILGETTFRLVPRNNCHEICDSLVIKLVQGETLIVGALWNVEYHGAKDENLAVILEMN